MTHKNSKRITAAPILSYLEYVGLEISPVVHSNIGVVSTHGHVFRHCRVYCHTFCLRTRSCDGQQMDQDSSFVWRSTNVGLPKVETVDCKFGVYKKIKK